MGSSSCSLPNDNRVSISLMQSGMEFHLAWSVPYFYKIMGMKHTLEHLQLSQHALERGWEFCEEFHSNPSMGSMLKKNVLFRYPQSDRCGEHLWKISVGSGISFVESVWAKAAYFSRTHLVFFILPLQPRWRDQAFDLEDWTPSICMDSVALHSNLIGLWRGWVSLRVRTQDAVGYQQAFAHVSTVVSVTKC